MNTTTCKYSAQEALNSFVCKALARFADGTVKDWYFFDIGITVALHWSWPPASLKPDGARN
jgi:hypothetical protein